jgi:uncharacterized membrane protein
VSNLYAWLKFLHLVGLAVFLFGHGITAGSAMAVRRRPGAAVSRAMLGVSMRSYAVAYPGLLLLVVTGVWMAFLGGFWHSGWIWASIAVLVAILAVMGALSVPYHRARDAKDDDAALDQTLGRARPIVVSWAGSIGLLALIFLMVFKPF